MNGCCLLLIKWNVRKGYLKIHVVAVDIKKKTLDATSEEVHENCTMLKRLVDNASENNDVKSIIADGAYDGKENFRYQSVSQPDRSCSQGKENSNRLIGCCHSRKIVIVLQQLKNFER